LTEAQVALGAALLQSGDAEASEDAYRKVIAAQPNNPDAYLNLGNALFTKHQYGPAAEAYRESIRLRPDSARAHYNLAICLQWLNDSEAAAEFKEAVRLDPSLKPTK
jgi:cytochrome c-type biogenesis protein CcmH/NrfG